MLVGICWWGLLEPPADTSLLSLYLAVQAQGKTQSTVTLTTMVVLALTVGWQRHQEPERTSISMMAHQEAERFAGLLHLTGL